MEFLPALPAELVAVADPSARGAAPLLRSAAGGTAAATAALPFADFLALLTEPVLAGESWPAPGKELPLLPVEPASADLASAAPLVLPMLPSAIAATSLPPQVPAEIAPIVSDGSRASAPAGEPLLATPVDALPLPQDDATSSSDIAAQVPAELELVAAPAAEQPLLPPDGAELEAAALPAKSSVAPSWLEAFTHERRLQRPASAVAVDARAAPAVQASAAAPAAAITPSAALGPAASPAPAAVEGIQPGVELPKLFAHVVSGEGASVSQADWLPPTSHGNATASAAPATTPAAQGAPVDTRSPGWQEAFASRVQWSVDQQIGEAHIKLNPPELGAVDVKISLVDDKTYVQLTTATAAARDELAQSLPRLRELLTVSGLELGGASVQNGRYGHQSGNGHGAETAAARSFDRFADDRAEPPVLVPRRSVGRIDVFA
jgi:flagellar hook-length control protein FliK